MTIAIDETVVQAVEPVVENRQAAETGSDLAELLDGDVVAQLTKDAQKAGIPLSGEGGLLKQLTKMVLETALQGEMDAHLGYGKHEPAGRNGGNSRNGTRSKTVVTDVGPVQIEVPRDRDASFTPQIVAKRQRRLSGVDDLVISLTPRGLTSDEICAHLAEVYGTSVSKETISVITDRMLGTMAEWQARPLRGLSGAVRGLRLHEDPRRAGRQPARLRRPGHHRPRWQGCARAVGRRQRRRGRQALAARVDRDQEPGRGQCVRRGVRRAQGGLDP